MDQSETQSHKDKTKEEYSRNVKKLKFKLQTIRSQILAYQHKILKLSNTSNDQIIAMKINKFCKQRKFTPEMLFRFADTNCLNLVTRTQFRTTLLALGFKLSQQELTRLEYLLDEDLKGDISLLQYSKYLHSFGLKAEHDPNDPFVKQTLSNIDFNKILKIAKQDQNKNKNKNLLSWEQFLTYCHKNFPKITDNQLGKIFNKLAHDQLIDFQTFIDYIENLLKQKNRIDNKNKPTIEKPPEKDKVKDKIVVEEEEIIDITTLKGKLMAVLKSHPTKQQTFHSSEFKRVETDYKLPKAEMLTLFREMDSQMTGSLSYNDLIFFYVQLETYKPNNHFLIKYAFVLMGKKLFSQGQQPQTLIASYAQHESFITLKQFAKLCQLEFGLKEELSKKLYEVLLNSTVEKLNPQCVNTSLVVSLMKINRQGVKNNIKPILSKEHQKYLYKKEYQTICTNGIVAYKICESLMSQLASVSAEQKWDDLEFGPSTDDELGLDSIGSNISNPNIKWHRAQNLGMKDFFLPANSDSSIYSLSPMCSNDLFYKSLQTLIKYDPHCLSRKSSQIVKNSKKVEQSELVKLFQGIHPLAFHRFQSRGIFVIQFFVKGKFVYVIVDNKIPCNSDDELLFARPPNTACSFLPLIQKAYAKLKGSYQKIFDAPSLPKYLYELSSRLVSYLPIDDSSSNSPAELSQLLAASCNLQLRKKHLQKSQLQKQTSNQVFLGLLALGDKKMKPVEKCGLQPNTMAKIHFSSQIKSPENPSTTHTLSFLEYLYSTNPQQTWNPKWQQKSPTFKSHELAIKAEVNKWDNQNDTSKIYINAKLSAIILDPQTICETFNSIVEMVNFRFDDNGVALRKELEFENNYSCLYKVNSTDKSHNVKLVIVLSKIRGPDDAKVSVIVRNSAQKDANENKKIQSHWVRGDFGCISLAIPQAEQEIEIKVDKFDRQQQYIYQLSFYFEHPRYSLKERDRHLLFRYVSEYEERSKLEFDWLSENQKKYFYEYFFPNANRKGFLCC